MRLIRARRRAPTTGEVSVKAKLFALLSLALLGVGCGGGTNSPASLQAIPGTSAKSVAHVFLVVGKSQLFDCVSQPDAVAQRTGRQIRRRHKLLFGRARLL